MCTVTYLPSDKGLLLTSNRDEKTVRLPAIAPAVYSHGVMPLLYPKDGQAGGTWIGVAGNGALAVLLNGGFIPHEPLAAYRKSRGLVFLDILETGTPLKTFERLSLLGIEPFTLVIWDNGSLYECRWSGEEKYRRLLNADQPHIWSSVTLYTADTIRKREQWFARWLEQYPAPALTDIVDFHLWGGEGDIQNNIQMNRFDVLKTVSITSVDWQPHGACMLYRDLQANTLHESMLAFASQAQLS